MVLKELHDIHVTLSTANDDYNDIKRKLKKYFKPRMNLTFEVKHF